MVKHIVLFSFNKALDSPEVQEIDRRFKELPSLIDEIVDFECGTDVSIEGIAKGYEKAYVLTFKNEEDRTSYFHHPDHQAFGKAGKPYFKDVLVFDYIPES